MKRYLLLLSFICIGIIKTGAQVRVALVGGIHQSGIIEKNDIPGFDTTSADYSKRTGIHLGFMADLPLSPTSSFSIQPGIIFHNKGRKYAHDYDTTVSSTLSVRSTEYLNYIDFPINLVYKLRLGRSAKFIIGAGPYASFFYGGKTKKETVSKALLYTLEENDDLPVGKGKDQYSTLDYGVNGLAGFELGRVSITAKYARGLKDIYDASAYTVRDYKHEVMGVSLGIFLGKPVKMAPKDRDKDGVNDNKDKCPDIPGSVQFSGCPDTDSDGIPDYQDSCASQAGPVENKGCPYPDADGDGVLDKDDRCPAVAGPADNAGCPYPDTDGDGIVDKDDKCPAIAGLQRYQGCPIPDTDDDGVHDEDDKCPQEKGVPENNGCPPVIQQEMIEKVEFAAKQIQFKVNSATLIGSSFKVLDEVAALLAENPLINLSIEGHTSQEGRYETNMKLSQTRADAVMSYLVKKGVAPDRLEARGYGPDRPLNSGRTAAEKAKNRRVELKLRNQ